MSQTARRIALVQMTSGIDPQANSATIVKAAREAAGQGAQVLFTPEMAGLLDRKRKRAAANIVAEEDNPAVEQVARRIERFRVLLTDQENEPEQQQRLTELIEQVPGYLNEETREKLEIRRGPEVVVKTRPTYLLQAVTTMADRCWYSHVVSCRFVQIFCTDTSDILRS